MTDTQTFETQVVRDDQTQLEDPLVEDHRHSSSDGRRAAAVEAAYILEALRR